MSYFGRWGQCRYFIKCNESYEVLVPIYILIEVVRVEYQWFSVNFPEYVLFLLLVGNGGALRSMDVIVLKANAQAQTWTGKAVVYKTSG